MKRFLPLVLALFLLLPGVVFAQGVTIHAYTVSNTDDALSIFDVSIPAVPSLEGSIQGAGAPNFLNTANGVFVLGDFAYVTSIFDNSLSIFNIADPTSPTLSGSIQGAGAPNFLSGARKVFVVGIYAYVTLRTGKEITSGLKKELVQTVRKEIGPHATPDKIQFTPALPKTRSGKIMRRILRKISEGTPDQIGDTSTLADPSIVDALIEGRQ